jgi:hypothetical protein
MVDGAQARWAPEHGPRLTAPLAEQIDRDLEQYIGDKETVQPYLKAKAHPRPAVMRMISLKDTKAAIAPLWGPLGMTQPLWERYLNAYCIELCMMDGAFELVPQVCHNATGWHLPIDGSQSARKLARDGLNPASVEYTSTSRTKNAAHIVAMISDFKRVPDVPSCRDHGRLTQSYL